MSGAVGLDLRIPIGGLFAALGVLLVAYGAATASDTARYARSGGLNVNLWWGLVLLAVGVLFLLAARRSNRLAGARPALESPEGRRVEEYEHQAGLEREPGA